jgi:hypothetical protein
MILTLEFEVIGKKNCFTITDFVKNKVKKTQIPQKLKTQTQL